MMLRIAARYELTPTEEGYQIILRSLIFTDEFPFPTEHTIDFGDWPLGREAANILGEELVQQELQRARKILGDIIEERMR